MEEEPENWGNVGVLQTRESTTSTAPSKRLTSPKKKKSKVEDASNLPLTQDQQAYNSDELAGLGLQLRAEAKSLAAFNS